MKPYDVGLICGRFQAFHNKGHREQNNLIYLIEFDGEISLLVSRKF